MLSAMARGPWRDGGDWEIKRRITVDDPDTSEYENLNDCSDGRKCHPKILSTQACNAHTPECHHCSESQKEDHVVGVEHPVRCRWGMWAPEPYQ